MNSEKKRIIQRIEELPDHFSSEDILQNLITNCITDNSMKKIDISSINQLIEIEKLKLERKRADKEYEIQCREIELKNEDNKLKEKQSKFPNNFLGNPATTAIIAALAGFLTSSIVAFIQGQSNVQLEELKFQSNLISKGIESNDEKKRLELLNFYINAGLIKDRYIVDKLKILIKERKVPQAPTWTNLYEGNVALGNNHTGDGFRFRGRGYVMLVGRANYEKYSRLIGIDIASNPNLAAEPQIAAKILVSYMIDEYGSQIRKYLETDNLIAAGRLMGDSNGKRVAERTKIYLKALQSSGTLPKPIQVPGITNPEWLKVHVPVILARLQDKGVTDPILKALALASAESNSVEGSVMTEL